MQSALFLSLVLVAACGGKVALDDGATGSGGAPSTGATTSTVTGTGTGAGGACPDGGMPIPAELKTCASIGDCTEQLIYVDCCGRQEAIGVSASQVDAFQTFEKACNPVVPACSCAAGPTLAEDGNSIGPDAPIQVGCDSGICMTSVP